MGKTYKWHCKGWVGNIAQMGLSPKDEIFRMTNNSHYQNMRIFGGSSGDNLTSGLKKAYSGYGLIREYCIGVCNIFAWVGFMCIWDSLGSLVEFLKIGNLDFLWYV